MESSSIRKYIIKAIERSKIAEPYSMDFFNSLPDDIFSVSDDNIQLDQHRVVATLAKIALDKYFKEHPEDTIENYID